MKIHRTEFDGLIYLEPKSLETAAAGFTVMEQERYSEIEITEDFVRTIFPYHARVCFEVCTTKAIHAGKACLCY